MLQLKNNSVAHALRYHIGISACVYSHGKWVKDKVEQENPSQHMY
jgi:hypothetical protein